MEILLGALFWAYVISDIVSYVSYDKYDETFKDKLKRLGYVDVTPKKSESEQSLDNFKFGLKRFFCIITPILNLTPIGLLWDFDKVTNRIIYNWKMSGRIKKVEEIESSKTPKEEYLQERINTVKKFQNQLGQKNVPRSFSDYSNDEIIAILLHELELAYKRKAEMEDIDLNEKMEFIEGTQMSYVKEKSKRLELTSTNANSHNGDN